MQLPQTERDVIIERYSRRFAEHGYDPRTLGWDKGKQQIRFRILTSQYDFRGKRVLDIGCGFGDLNQGLQRRAGQEYSYHGVDLVPALIAKGKDLYPAGNTSFSCADILSEDFTDNFDYAVASGLFNFTFKDVANYDFIEAVINKALSLCRDGLAFDFLSDKVDRRQAEAFYSSPEQILGMAYKYSRNVVLRNDYMPFEFAVFINKDSSFLTEDTIFHHYKMRGLGRSDEDLKQTV
jgi:SAM-dependent methyltransferase